MEPEYYGRGIGRPVRLGLWRIGPDAFTIALAGNVRALALYRSEGFAAARTFESKNAGYPCTDLRPRLDAGHG